jgi:hypothetical protein
VPVALEMWRASIRKETIDMLRYYELRWRWERIYFMSIGNLGTVLYEGKIQAVKCNQTTSQYIHFTIYSFEKLVSRKEKFLKSPMNSGTVKKPKSLSNYFAAEDKVLMLQKLVWF